MTKVPVLECLDGLIKRLKGKPNLLHLLSYLEVVCFRQKGHLHSLAVLVATCTGDREVGDELSGKVAA